jgi:4-diphosphocytidyl-2-C-methyl-D-erythritol kinase
MYPKFLTDMLCFPNAKINLGLNIIEKRDDGFHSIETVFCPAGLSDILEFVPEPALPPGTCIFDSTGIAIDGPDEKNLCVRAYHLLADRFNLPGVHIHLHKIIPPGAGLGGGSSDAAFMLKHLDLQFSLNLGEDKLSALASQLGSDCAFFIRNRPMFGYDRGNLFRELSSFPQNLHLVIVNPGIHISTAEAYASVTPHKPLHPLEELILLPVSQWKNRIVNDFEPAMIAKFPVIGEIRDRLYDLGAYYASMSGSGSSVYGLFYEKAPAISLQFPDFFCWPGPV